MDKVEAKVGYSIKKNLKVSKYYVYTTMLGSHLIYFCFVQFVHHYFSVA